MRKQVRIPNMNMSPLGGGLTCLWIALAVLFPNLQILAQCSGNPLVTPTEVDGNPAVCEGGLRIDPVVSGEYTTDDGFKISIVVSDDDKSFSWKSEYPITLVVAKGGDKANLYDYDDVCEDTGCLVAPNNSSGGPAGLSHIDFCYTPPVLECPKDTTIECDDSTQPLNTGLPKVTPGLCVTAKGINFEWEDEETPGACDNQYTIERTFEVTIFGFPTLRCTQTIEVVDTTAPVITCPGPAVVGLGCNPESIPDPKPEDVEATDNCGIPVITVEKGTVESIGCNFSRTDLYIATDVCGNADTCYRNYIWNEDMEPPVISCPGTLDLGEFPAVIPEPLETDISATDNCGSMFIEITKGTVVEDGCDRSRVDQYIVKDACGNADTCYRTVLWSEGGDAPVLTCPDDEDLGCNPEVIPSASADQVSVEPADAAITVVEGEIVRVDACSRSRTDMYIATNNCGLADTCYRTLSWTQDRRAPECWIDPTRIVLDCNSGLVPDITIAVRTRDRCSGRRDMVITQSPTAGTPFIGSVMISVTVTDACGNSSMCDYQVACTPPDEEPACTYTPGYWKNHEEDICEETIDCVGDVLSALEGKGSNPWTILARAYTAAYLNNNCGVGSWDCISDAITEAQEKLCNTTKEEAAELKGAAKGEWTSLADLIDAFNNGAGGADCPEHCDAPLSELLAAGSVQSPVIPAVDGQISYRVFPNPFQGQTTIQFTLPYDSKVNVVVYNAAGQVVNRLFEGQIEAGRTQQLEFAPASQGRQQLYFYKLTTDREIITGRLLLLE